MEEAGGERKGQAADLATIAGNNLQNSRLRAAQTRWHSVDLALAFRSGVRALAMSESHVRKVIDSAASCGRSISTPMRLGILQATKFEFAPSQLAQH